MRPREYDTRPRAGGRVAGMGGYSGYKGVEYPGYEGLNIRGARE